MIRRQTIPIICHKVYNEVKENEGIMFKSLRNKFQDISEKDFKYAFRILREIKLVTSRLSFRNTENKIDRRSVSYTITDKYDIYENKEEYHPILWETITEMIA